MIPERVRAILEQHHLTAIEFEEGSTPTAPLAAQKLGVRVGQIAKSILVRAKDESFYLVLCPGDRRLSSAKLKARAGAKVRLATAEETEAATGLRPGSVCPFGIDSIPILIDEGLKQHATIYPSAGTDGSGVPMSFEQLVAITGGAVCDLTNVPEEA
jgi:prolyl-tRNA editing enzyme YbaK/EbsC (Cys-tRNA(Pro) deacylase)